MEAVRERLRALAAAGTLMTSVCTGALVFADAGLLDGRPATTHWGSLELLATLGERIEVRSDERFVDAGEVMHGRPACPRGSTWRCIRGSASLARARGGGCRYIQYDPQPPV